MTSVSGTHMYSCTHLVNYLYRHSDFNIFKKTLSTLKFDLAIMKVNVNPGSYFEHILWDLSPDCCITESMVIGLFLSYNNSLMHFHHIWA